MKRLAIAVLLLAAAFAIGAGGYWLGLRRAATSPQMAAVTTPEATAIAAPAAGSERKILYYRDPMGKPDYSPVPKKDSMGMDYIPVYEGEGNNVTASAAPAAAPARRSGKGKILYYRNPMGLPDTSPAPKKDSMGMDYIPVYEGEEDDESGTVKINPARVQQLGVQSEPVQLRRLARTIRAVGTVQPDERRLFVVNTKFDGWIEKLYVNATGQAVRRGEPLMEVYAPELVVAEREYLLAWQSLRSMANAGAEDRSAARQLAAASLQRLRNWDISDDQLKRLRRGVIARTLILRAPADGIVLEKMAVEGMRFMAGAPLYRIAELSSVWVLAEVFEQDIGAVREGDAVKLSVDAYPGSFFNGRVAFIYPTVTQETRTGKVRVVVPNLDGRLKAGMYANIEIASVVADRPVIAVPESAVIDSGTKQAVLVERSAGTFQPRDVKLGAHAEGYYEVREGLRAGERVVVSANFLIDAESNLRAAFKAFAPTPKQTANPAGSGGKR
ncbi:MAG TPA: efflux RND transporter periplasmic adaptor subunit [Stellaceae bacterium]|nr:efflux RND transporter periplasmic adaptor subunit [Stellaceae bacterium]